MFGAEQRHQLHARRVREHVHGGTALRILAGVIGDESHVLAAQGRESFRLQYIHTRLHSAVRQRGALLVHARACCGCAAPSSTPAMNNPAHCSVNKPLPHSAPPPSPGFHRWTHKSQ